MFSPNRPTLRRTLTDAPGIALAPRPASTKKSLPISNAQPTRPGSRRRGWAAAFLERAAALSPDPGARARRALEAADAKELAGAPQAASALLAAAAEGPLGERESALAERLKGQIALDLRRFGEAVPFLVQAARRLESIEPALARATYLEALRAAHIGAPFGGELLRHAAEAARNTPSPSGTSGAFDLLLAGLAIRSTDGYAASAVLLKRALRALRDQDGRDEEDVRWPGFARAVALDLFDDHTCHAICTRSVELARERGAVGVLPLALNYLAVLRTFEGDLDAAEALVEESDAIIEATGAARIEFAKLPLAGSRGDEAALSKLVEASEPVALPEVRACCLPSASTPVPFSTTASATMRRRFPRQGEQARETS